MIYKRVPPVFSLEYLRVFLNTIKSEGYDRKAIRTAIFNERLKFEQEKFKAIGRGYRLKTVKSEQLVRNCYQLSIQTGLLQREDTEIVLSKESAELIENGIGNPKTKSMLLSKLLSTYIPFSEILFGIRKQVKSEVLLPLRKEKGLFKGFSEKYGLGVYQIQFEVVRDLLTQLEILNWREKKEPERMQSVYLIANVVRLTESKDFTEMHSQLANTETVQVERFLEEIGNGDLPAKDMPISDLLQKTESKGYVTIRLPGDLLFIKPFSVGNLAFEDVLWTEYLKSSDLRSNYPVYYSELRDVVCETLRISDKRFDSFIKRMINRPMEYSVKLHPCGGPMPPRRGLSSMLKVLPPKTGSDEYITFIKANK